MTDRQGRSETSDGRYLQINPDQWWDQTGVGLVTQSVVDKHVADNPGVAIRLKRYNWRVSRFYLATMPDEIVADSEVDLEAQMTALAEAAKGQPIGPLEFEHMTDQVDVFFRRNGRRRVFATLMAG